MINYQNKIQELNYTNNKRQTLYKKYYDSILKLIQKLQQFYKLPNLSSIQTTHENIVSTTHYIVKYSTHESKKHSKLN